MKKRNFLYLCMAAIVAFAFCGCSNDDEELVLQDWSPIKLCIYIQNEKGWNLLNEGQFANVLNHPISLTHNGQTYKWNEVSELEKTETRYYAPKFEGLTAKKDSTNRVYLQFGELDGSEEYVNETFVLEWDGGRRDVIVMNRKITNRRKMQAETTFTLNGEPYEPEGLLLGGKKFVLLKENDSDNRPIYDFGWFDLKFYVKDAEGNNLLDKTVEGNIANEEITLTYQGKTYAKDGGNNPVTRDSSGWFYGLATMKDSNGQPYLSFGELDSTTKFVDEPIVITWGDGSTEEILMSQRLYWNYVDPIIERTFILNGETHEGDTFLFVK